MSMNSRRFLGFTLLLALLGARANAQWTVVNLHPGGAQDYSWAYAAGGGQQVGSAFMGYGRASLWTGTAASWVDLTPAGAFRSEALGAGGGQQVGFTRVLSFDHASLWSGTAASWVDLHPAGTNESAAYGVGGGRQVGWARVAGGADHASLWSGSAASWVDLHPAAWTESYAQGVDGGQQAGVVYFNSPTYTIPHASLWSDTAASWMDLNPAAGDWSFAYGINGGQQVGWVRVGGVGGYQHASLWSGSAASWVDLNPAGEAWSEAFGVHGGQQVGYAFGADGHNRASLWSGSAASWVDLHAFVPPGITHSYARGIWHAGAFTYVVGYGFRSATGRDEALMWVFAPIYTPFCYGDGSATPCPCGNSGSAGHGCANSLHAGGAGLAASGTPSISSDTLTLLGTDMPNSSCLYFQGTSQPGGGLGVAFGDGLRCVGGTVVRLGTRTNAGGASQYPAAGDQPVSVRGLCAAGDVRHYQTWYRNADALFCTPSAFNLSNGVSLTWQP